MAQSIDVRHQWPNQSLEPFTHESEPDGVLEIKTNEEFDKIYRLSRGNPLSIKLLSADSLEGLEARFSPEERALLRVLRLRQESN